MHRGSVAFIDIKSLSQSVLAVLFAAGIRGLRYSIRKQKHLVSRIEPHCYIPILRTAHRSALGQPPRDDCPTRGNGWIGLRDRKSHQRSIISMSGLSVNGSSFSFGRRFSTSPTRQEGPRCEIMFAAYLKVRAASKL